MNGNTCLFFYPCIAMNHFATEVRDTRLKVPVLTHDVNHASQQ